MSATAQDLLEERAIEAVLNQYARACDERNWNALGAVFGADASVNYGGEFKLQGREPIVDMVRSMLGGCGPTQHLLGNFDITVSETSATCRCYVRAVHAGTGEQSGQYYEVWAEYRDTLKKTGNAWHITEREMAVSQEVGTRAVLRPEVS
ncbi:MAG: nuclear transport factor 2 family protein [Halioglobus sp.]